MDLSFKRGFLAPGIEVRKDEKGAGGRRDRGRASPGRQPAPSLVELCERFDVSRGTVSRALRILRDEEIIGGLGSRGLMVLKRPR
jgi:hypothetical protein